ncbi:MAG: hypothetical protein MK188_16355, partial [Gammaproteobacteria bacterium]|nr:hypothetical protein [Gammaproteobacteria bacterium]
DKEFKLMAVNQVANELDSVCPNSIGSRMIYEYSKFRYEFRKTLVICSIGRSIDQLCSSVIFGEMLLFFCDLRIVILSNHLFLIDFGELA